MSNTLSIIILLVMIGITGASAESGGPLSPEQAAYDVSFYDLDLYIDPVEQSLSGSLLCKAVVVDPLSNFILDLDHAFTVDSILYKQASGLYIKPGFVHSGGVINVTLPQMLVPEEMLEIEVFYSGKPRVAVNPPWGTGFVWRTSPSGGPWIGVACESSGADIWWPCKDHPSDEPDSMAMSFTVPNPLTCVSNGRFMGSKDNGDNTSTFDWFVSTPINNYNVSIYAAEYSLIEDDYLSTSGELIPFRFWVLPGSYNIALGHMDVFKKEFDFFEASLGPFPFGGDKHGWAHAPYWGMEHQSIIAYGHNFSVNNWGMDYIHYHELAHEWWGNLLTAKDWSDIWIHEGLATYMEALYVEHLSGRAAYHQYLEDIRPEDNHILPLAPRKNLTADQAFGQLDSYHRGALVMHSLRYHLGDALFFELLKRWIYPKPDDTDNSRGQQCRILSTEDMKDEAELITGVDLDPFFEAFLRSTDYPSLEVIRESDVASFTWSSRFDHILDVDIPVRVNGVSRTIDMAEGTGLSDISATDDLVIDPEGWLLMADPLVIVTTDGESQGPAAFHLRQNYPNPFNPSTTIEYVTPKDSRVELLVYSVQGKLVNTLVSEFQHAGLHRVEWSGQDALGGQLSSGMYLARLQSEDLSSTVKMLYIP